MRQFVILSMALAITATAAIAENSVVLVREFDDSASDGDCVAHDNCEEWGNRWPLQVEKQISGPKVPARFYATQFAQTPRFIFLEDREFLVVLTPITDAALHQRTGAAYIISDMSYQIPMYCLGGAPGKFGLDIPDREVYLLPGSDTACFPSYLTTRHKHPPR
jgi:hypothetical protein